MIEALGGYPVHDGHWVITSVPIGENFYTVPYNAYIALGIDGPWYPGLCVWIAPQPYENQFIDQPGYYTYETVFDVPDIVSATRKSYPMYIGADNYVHQIILNGVVVASFTDEVMGSFDRVDNYTLSATFQPKKNVMQMIVYNIPYNSPTMLNPTGLYVRCADTSCPFSDTGKPLTAVPDFCQPSYSPTTAPSLSPSITPI